VVGGLIPIRYLPALVDVTDRPQKKLGRNGAHLLRQIGNAE